MQIQFALSTSPAPYQEPKLAATRMEEYIKMHSTPQRSVHHGKQCRAVKSVPFEGNKGTCTRRNSEPDLQGVFANFPYGSSIPTARYSVENIYERIQ